MGHHFSGSISSLSYIISIINRRTSSKGIGRRYKASGGRFFVYQRKAWEIVSRYDVYDIMLAARARRFHVIKRVGLFISPFMGGTRRD